ncbi:tetratricopeptide repeat protein [Agathobaculum sp.]|uniref:tetratricopeptide repeat protein n=1 Tax=Agathobaculum sp. TaxID=2048138 RepID=UPI002A821065|nr:tetratricopeptide repeat protein [Agathobaculum sp.]MDY3618478.1 tetratricopeptide repeat protein [Agathobaculum sp.]
MLKLFPSYWLLPYGGGAVLLFIAIRKVLDGTPLWLAALLLILGCVLLFVLAEAGAFAAHQRKLSWLYQNLAPERFLKVYEKLLPRSKKNPAREVTVRAHLANAYLALGDFEKAIALLNDAPEVSGEGKDSSTVLLLNNKATVYLFGEQPEQAKHCIDQLHELLDKPGNEQLKERFTESERILRDHYDALTGVCKDDAYLRELNRNSTTELFRVNTSMLLARVYLSQKETELALSYLEQLAEKGTDWMWASIRAKEMLKELKKK